MKNIMLFLMALVMSCHVMAQQGRITGTVTDSNDGSGMPGVNVLVKGTTNGTITDMNGKFSLNVSTKNAVLVISSVGYKPQEVRLKSDQKIVNVVLEENSELLDEVVVVGYGTMKKSDLTGSVGSLSGDKLKESVTANFDQAMQGRIAGVQVTSNSGTPGAATTIRIRGASSINGDNEPLYIIDGIPVQGTGTSIAGFDWAGGSNGQNRVNPLSAISPSDILSVDVLKDASACAIYGAAGANGVVMVTTRRGKSGEVKINYDGYVSSSSLPKKLDMMNLKQFAVYQQEISADLGNTLSDYFKDPSILGEGQDWQDAIFQTAAAQSHSLSVSGGSDKTQFSVSGSWFDQDGIVIGSGFDRFNSLV